MEPTARSELIATGLERPDVEIWDFDRVVQLYQPSIFRFLLASLRDRDAAESLTQDCLLRAYRNRHRFRGDSSVKTWLMQIAANLVRDQRRNRRLQFWRRAEPLPGDARDAVDRVAHHETSPEAQTVLREQVQAIWESAENLPEKQRLVFLLRFVEDMDLAEIAQVLGSSEGTVKVHLFRAVHKVRARMRRMS
jgi:RNA polymerase sigma-70 factor (ECF subfamily)